MPYGNKATFGGGQATNPDPVSVTWEMDFANLVKGKALARRESCDFTINYHDTPPMVADELARQWNASGNTLIANRNGATVTWDPPPMSFTIAGSRTHLPENNDSRPVGNTGINVNNHP